MAKIVPNQPFLEGSDCYEAGVEYEVDDALAFYFGRCGWLTDTEGDPQPAETTLEVQSASHAQEGENVNG